MFVQNEPTNHLCRKGHHQEGYPRLYLQKCRREENASSRSLQSRWGSRGTEPETMSYRNTRLQRRGLEFLAFMTMRSLHGILSESRSDRNEFRRSLSSTNCVLFPVMVRKPTHWIPPCVSSFHRNSYMLPHIVSYSFGKRAVSVEKTDEAKSGIPGGSCFIMLIMCRVCQYSEWILPSDCPPDDCYC